METTDNRKISLAIISFNEYEKISADIELLSADKRIAEFVILETERTDEADWAWEDWLQFDAPDNVKMINEKHRELSQQEKEETLVVMADSEWVLLIPHKGLKIIKALLDDFYNWEWDTPTLEMDNGVILIERNKYLESLEKAK